MQQIKNQAAFACGQLAERMVAGYFAHTAAIWIGTDERASDLLPATQQGYVVPIGTVYHKDGTPHEFHYKHYLELRVPTP